jgi:hypothetical protein
MNALTYPTLQQFLQPEAQQTFDRYTPISHLYMFYNLHISSAVTFPKQSGAAGYFIHDDFSRIPIDATQATFITVTPYHYCHGFALEQSDVENPETHELNPNFKIIILNKFLRICYKLIDDIEYDAMQLFKQTAELESNIHRPFTDILMHPESHFPRETTAQKFYSKWCPKNYAFIFNCNEINHEFNPFGFMVIRRPITAGTQNLSHSLGITVSARICFVILNNNSFYKIKLRR